MPLTRSVILKLASLSWIENFVRHSFLFRPLVHRFVAGNNLTETFQIIEPLAQNGFCISLDCLGENVKEEKEADQAMQIYIQTLERIAGSPFLDQINISIKLTECGLDQSESVAKEHYHKLLETAQKYNIHVRVDMESSHYTKSTLKLVKNAFIKYKNTGTVLQSSLQRTLMNAKDLIRLGIDVRLVKGAYLEPKEVAYQNKTEVDQMYLKLAKLLLKEGHNPAIATHDEKILNELKSFIHKEKIDKDQFEFQMLYGIRRDLQETLRLEGYRVRIYTPFGENWYPYFTRRLAERPANLFFVFKSLFKG